MSYDVATSGQLLLPEQLEKQVLTVLEVELAHRQGTFEAGTHVDTLGELAAHARAEVRRDGDWLHLATRPGSPVEWSDQATAFYVGLARWVQQGEVHLQGPDGARWSYRYGPDGVIQIGQNGWDGSLVPFGEPMTRPAADPAAPVSADPWERLRAGADADAEQPRNRSVMMALLLVVGVFLIVAVAMLAAGAVG